jgi:electron transfer flavoprotein beta subunit
VNILVCVKRVPATGGRIALTADGQEIDTRFLGFTVSPHEECAVEEAVRIVEAHGGSSTVLTLGPAEAEEQLRDTMAIGVDAAIHLTTDGREWGPMATAAAIVDAVRGREAASGPFDLILFGNESADSGGFQVGIRVAHALGRPVVTGAKELRIEDGRAIVGKGVSSGLEVYEVPLPAVVTVREGINLPRYPSVPGRLRARKKEIERVTPEWRPDPVTKVALRVPAEEGGSADILGYGPEAAPAVVELMRRLGVLP